MGQPASVLVGPGGARRGPPRARASWGTTLLPRLADWDDKSTHCAEHSARAAAQRQRAPHRSLCRGARRADGPRFMPARRRGTVRRRSRDSADIASPHLRCTAQRIHATRAHLLSASARKTYLPHYNSIAGPPLFKARMKVRPCNRPHVERHVPFRARDAAHPDGTERRSPAQSTGSPCRTTVTRSRAGAPTGSCETSTPTRALSKLISF